MRSKIRVSVLLFLLLFITVLSVPVFADDENHSPTLIIPTKFRYLLIDMVQAIENPVTLAPTPIPTPVPTKIPEYEDSQGLVRAEDIIPDEEVLPAGLVPEKQYSGMGRGFVQTNFDVSFEAPGQKIENRERLTARGLFDVHVDHGFN